MKKCPCCKAPCEVEISPPYTAQWLEDDKVQTESRLGRCRYIYSPTKRKATVDEYITYQELKRHLEDLDVEYRSTYGSGRSISDSVRDRRRKKEMVEKTIKLLEEFIDFTQ